MKHLLVLLLVICYLNGTQASNLTISRPLLYIEEQEAYTVFNLSWENAWHNERNKDAIWLFFKAIAPEGGYQHIRVSGEGHRVVSSFTEKEVPLAIEVPEDQSGLFISPAQAYRGPVNITLKVRLDIEDFEGFNTLNIFFDAYGIEMVEIPEGSFVLGDSSPKAQEKGALYQADANGDFAGLPTVNSENQEFRVGKGGDLYYQAPRNYEGDQSGTIPASYPKGYSAFHMMKYEITEGQYVDFLNTLDSVQAVERVNYNERGYYVLGGSIQLEGWQYTTPHPHKPCPFLSWDDAMAFADWACLRPMTELEFTKAARGTRKAAPSDFPWGATSKHTVQRLPNKNGELTMINNWPESKLSDNTLEYFGASPYWVMDLSGSLWERVITIGHPNGRKFDGVHGDGTLSTTGFANTKNWPIGTEDAGGVGFRGGGFYGYNRAYHEYNPFSPIGYRPYEGWHGINRVNAYGTRLVRG